MKAQQPALSRGGAPLVLRCPACSNHHCDLCPGAGSCSCMHNKQAILATARERYANAGDSGRLAHSLGQLIALEFQRSARQERIRRSAKYAVCLQCGVRFTQRNWGRPKLYCADTCQWRAAYVRKRARLAAAGLSPSGKPLVTG